VELVASPRADPDRDTVQRQQVREELVHRVVCPAAIRCERRSVLGRVGGLMVVTGFGV
jgi:hypothetical protein